MRGKQPRERRTRLVVLPGGKVTASGPRSIQQLIDKTDSIISQMKEIEYDRRNIPQPSTREPTISYDGPEPTWGKLAQVRPRLTICRNPTK